MPPKIALLLSIFITIFLFIIDERSKGKISKALWVPSIWMMIVATRNISQWLVLLGFRQGGEGASVEQYLEGNPLDRPIYLAFIVVGILILSRRDINWSELFRKNWWLFLLIAYGGISIMWSDYPFVSLKRWIKGFGNIIMVLVILTEEEPAKAVAKVIKRCAFIFVPLSIIFIKYFPEIGKGYSVYGGSAYFMGAAGSKNALGALCMVFGYFFSWTLFFDRGRKGDFERKKKILASMVMLIMISWLVLKAQSATANICLLFGIIVALGMKLTVVQNLLKHGGIFAVAAICFGFVFLYIFDIQELFSKGVDMTGHSNTFWGRTVLWQRVLEMSSNPLIGYGFESFWLGDRIAELWEIYWWHPNQSHNGYVETYINLGFIGLTILLAFIFASYKNIIKSLKHELAFGGFRLGFLIMVLAYNVTEAAMKGLHFMWFMFLMCAIEYSKIAKNQSIESEGD